MPSFIADGYTFHAGIKPVEGIHDGLEFDYRPMSPAETAELSVELQGVSGAENRRIKAKKIVSKVLGWRSRPVDGKPGPKIPQLTEDILVGEKGPPHINTVLLTQMEDIVLWGGPPDYTSDEKTHEEEVKNLQTASS